MDQFRWKLIMEQEALREGRCLLICGLYWKQRQFLEEAYPDEAWKEPELLEFSLREQLMYLILLYLWKV